MQKVNGYSPLDYLTTKWVLIAFALSFPLYGLIYYLGDPGMARAAGISAMLVIIAARMCWDLKKRAWFWVTMILLALLHVPLILLFPWPNGNLPAISLMPFGVLDLAVMYGCIKLVEKMMIQVRAN
jgi:hypothetical protein